MVEITELEKAALIGLCIACNKALKARQPIHIVNKKVGKFIPSLRNSHKELEHLLKKLSAKGLIIIQKNGEKNYRLTREGWKLSREILDNI
jgi:predicted transcriptional regulator